MKLQLQKYLQMQLIRKILFIIYVLLRKSKVLLTKVERAKVKTKPFFHCQVTLNLEVNLTLARAKISLASTSIELCQNQTLTGSCLTLG
jgi:hypothetical protein